MRASLGACCALPILYYSFACSDPQILCIKLLQCTLLQHSTLLRPVLSLSPLTNTRCRQSLLPDLHKCAPQYILALQPSLRTPSGGFVSAGCASTHRRVHAVRKPQRCQRLIHGDGRRRTGCSWCSANHKKTRSQRVESLHSGNKLAWAVLINQSAHNGWGV